MRFIRFVLTKRHPDSGVEDGLFRLAYELRDSSIVETRDRQTLKEILDWFGKNLSAPDRFNRSKSKGYYRRATRGIAWFRDTATECLAHMHRMKEIIEGYGYPVEIVREERIGYIIYQDDFQVIAEPFSDTRTGSQR